MNRARGAVSGPYRDRVAAGDALARHLGAYAGRADVVVLGLPRGGVPVAARVALALHAPLDILVVRKLGLPGQPELAMGAVAGIDDRLAVVRNPVVVDRAGVGDAAFERVLAREVDQLRRRQIRYGGGRSARALGGRTVVVVDDGLATGSTMRAAVIAIRQQQPARVVVAVPVAAADTCRSLAEVPDGADEVVCPWTPSQFVAVGRGYANFTPTTDEDVRELLNRPAD